MKKQCRMKNVLNEIYGLLDEARKSLDEGVDRQYVKGIIVAAMMKLDMEE